MKSSRAAWIVLWLLGAAAGLILLLHDPDARDGSVLSREIAGRSSLSGSLAALTTGAGVSSSSTGPTKTPTDSKTALAASTFPPPASDDRSELHVQTRSGALKAGPGGPARSIFYQPALERPRPASLLERRHDARSPLERSPGYYPPDDPESSSVSAGRREAREVSLELSAAPRSMDALARAILSALRDKDEGALRALALTRREFETICWPEFPESRPITRITAEDAWSFSEASSRAGIGRMTGLHGGRDLELLQVESAGSFAYRNFTRRFGMTLVTRDRATGEVFRLASSPSWIERHGRFKVLLFKD